MAFSQFVGFALHRPAVAGRLPESPDYSKQRVHRRASRESSCLIHFYLSSTILYTVLLVGSHCYR